MTTMFESIVNRTYSAASWQKIPWDDPDFSRRMLREHLTQEHDAASRRTTIIERQVAWIHENVLAAQPGLVLDLGCGPGLYTARLAALGHTCTGIDFSPASIEYARQHSACTYVQGDVRAVPIGEGFDLAMMIYGELNTFTPEDAQLILDKAFAALKPGGALLLEPHPYEAVARLGSQPRSWYSAAAGLFSEQPYLCLQESFFEDNCAVSRHFVIDAETGAVTSYASSLRAYTEAEYRHLLRNFSDVTFYPSLANEENEAYLCAITARKPE
jgi:SAM-dependent methyltransferase